MWRIAPNGAAAKSMDKIEEMAKAIYHRRNGRNVKSWPTISRDEKRPYILDAHAAFEILRAPTPAMTMAGAAMLKAKSWPLPVDYISKLWSAMADAALD